MHEAAFARAALADPTTILGLELRPYSIAHELYLQKSEQRPTATIQKERDALIRAVLICCHTWAEMKRKEWGLATCFKMWLWGRQLRKHNFEVARIEFELYRIEGSIEFPLSDKPSGRGPSPRMPGAPFLLRLHQFLVLKLNLTEAEAWDYPLGLATMQWACYWEEQGGLAIYNWHDSEHDALVAKMEAEEAAAAGGTDA